MADDNMVERVARHLIWSCGLKRGVAHQVARNVIYEMREPSQAMVSAVGVDMTPSECTAVAGDYTAMIDAALAESATEAETPQEDR
jgi:hypothetical protein